MDKIAGSDYIIILLCYEVKYCWALFRAKLLLDPINGQSHENTHRNSGTSEIAEDSQSTQ